jgi:predicted ATP-grasp superfamily ATP-dependent carboligase
MDIRRFRPDRPPVVLLGGLNVARAAGVAGIPVIVASSNADNPAFHSRYCAGRLVLGASPAEELARFGERLSSHLGKPLPLFYGNDDVLELVLDNRGRLGSYYRFVLNDAEVAAAMFDKERFDSFMSARGLPVPRRLAWDDLAGFAHAVAVKPKVKVNFEASGMSAFLGSKARIFESGRAVLAEPFAREHRDALLFQEYIPGDERSIWSFHGYADAYGRLLAWFIGRKIRTWPPIHGYSCYLELAHNDAVAALGREFVARAPLKGVFKIDFKQHADTGRWVALEVNARSTLWHYLGAANGVNLTAIAYDYLVHGATPPAPPPYRTEYRWHSARLDWLAFRELRRRRKIDARAWLSSLATPRVYDLFSWRDPKPFLARGLQRVAGRLPRSTGRFTRWLFSAS